MEKVEYRAYIKTRTLLGISATEISKELESAHGTQAPKYSTVAKWTALFREGRIDLNDDPRSGRQITVHTAANIEFVRQIIEADPHSTFDDIIAQSSINRYTLGSIIHDSLRLRKLVSRWIPHDLSEKNRKERVEACQENLAKFKEGKWRLCDVITGDESWFYLRQIGHKSSNASWVKEGENVRTVVRRDRFEPKTMFSIFFKTTGVLHIDCMEKGLTITSNYYVENCLYPVLKEIIKQRPTSGATSMKIS